MNKTYIGIDISKKNLDVFVQSKYLKFKNEQSGFKKLLKKITSLEQKVPSYDMLLQCCMCFCWINAHSAMNINRFITFSITPLLVSHFVFHHVFVFA